MGPTAKIDLTALQHNFQQVQRHAPSSRVISVIKADAYGHGAFEVAQALTASDAFAVARLAEALALRQKGVSKAIVVLEGVMTASELESAAEHAISLVFHTQQQIQLMTTISLSKPLTFCWIMLDTGMFRLGFSEDEIDNARTTLMQSGQILGEIGLMSHFANADETARPENQQQLQRLQNIRQGNEPMSMANSAAIMSYPDSHGDWVRPGIMLYGSSPFADKTAAELGLKPVMKLHAQLIAIQTVDKGDAVGYGGDWQAQKTTEVGIVDIGYADGYSRHLSQRGKVLINQIEVSVLGRVSMDMIAIDLSEIPSAKIGQEVVLWGESKLTVDEVAKAVNTIAYELLCQVSPRVKRQYHGES